MHRCCCTEIPPGCDYCNDGGVATPTSYVLDISSVSNAASIDTILWTRSFADDEHTTWLGWCSTVWPPVSAPIEAGCLCHLAWQPGLTLYRNAFYNSYDPSGGCVYMGHSYRGAPFASFEGSASQATIDTFAWLEFDSDPDYLLLILETHFPVPNNAFEYQISTSILRVTYRTPKATRQCLCPICFEKVSETVGPDGDDFNQWCFNWPQFLTLIPAGRSVAVDCDSAEYGYGAGYGCYGNTTGGGGTSCGETTYCVYQSIANPSSPTGYSYYLSSSYCGTDGGCGCRPASYWDSVFPPLSADYNVTDTCYQ